MSVVLLAGVDTGHAATVIRALPDLIRADRDGRQISIRQQASLIGVGADTLTRLGQGSNPTQTTILACLDYLTGA